MNLRPGFLLVLEGIDGAGKSTLQRQLAEWCRSEGLAVMISREPTDGPHGRALRESARTGRLDIQAELQLFLDDRKEHVETLITPALARGEVVILDRYYFSTAAYQGARGVDPVEIVAKNEAFAPEPDLVLLLDLDPNAGRERIGIRGGTPDAFEGRDYLAEVRRIFLSLQKPYFRRLDASGRADDVFRAAAKEVRPELIKRKLIRP